MNIPYEMFLTIQMHLTCRKDHIHNHLQAKKNEDLFRRTSDNISKTKNNMMSADIIDAEPSSHQGEREDQFKKNDVRVQYRSLKRSS